MRLHKLLAPALAAAALACAHDALGAQTTLRGSRGTVDRTYRKAVQSDVTFYRSSRGVRAAAREGDLVRLPGNADYRLAGTAYPYALPTTRLFVTRLARQYRRQCGERMVVTSATRPKSYRVPNSIDKSVHPTGIAVDLRRPGKRGCAGWLRETLLGMESAGAIDATEEHHPPHFHVAVFPGPYRRYAASHGAARAPAPTPPKPAARPRTPARTATARIAQARAAPTREAPRRATYRVRQGDSLWAIARRTGVSVARLREANDLGGSARLHPGQTLVIPAR
jgi:hypothetical protein